MGFPTIDLMRTGANIVRLRKAAGLTVHDLQMALLLAIRSARLNG